MPVLRTLISSPPYGLPRVFFYHSFFLPQSLEAKARVTGNTTISEIWVVLYTYIPMLFRYCQGKGHGSLHSLMGHDLLSVLPTLFWEQTDGALVSEHSKFLQSKVVVSWVLSDWKTLV